MIKKLLFSKFLFIFLILFTPLAFGTVEPWSYAIMEILTAFALFIFLVAVVKKNEKLYAVPGIIPLLILLGYVLFQLVPLPSDTVKLLSPAAFEVYQGSNLFSNTSKYMTLSLNHQATLSEFFRYSTYVMFYVLTIQLLKDKHLMRNTVLIIAFFGGILAVSSILQFYLTENVLLWFRPSPKNSIIVGPYVNHNHYAGLMEMIFPIVLSLFFFYRPRIKNTSLFKGIAEIFSSEKANIHILIGTAVLLIITSIFVSLSRSAMISTFLSLILFTLLLIKRKVSRGNTVLIVGVIMVTAISIGWFGWDQIFDRFAKLKNAQGVIHEARFDFWEDSKQMVEDYKITGSGFGSYRYVYPTYRTITTKLTLTHAHNDYLELLCEGGLIAFGLLSVFFLIVIYKTYLKFTERKQAFSIYLYMGSITAVTAILLHSFTDFNTHIGANGLWFFFVLGMTVSATHTNFKKLSISTRLSEVTSSFKKYVCFALVFVLLGATVWYNFSNLIGQFYFSNIKNHSMSAETPAEELKTIEKIAEFASRFNLLNGEYRFSKANSAWFLKDIEKAKINFQASLMLDPLNSRYLKRAGIFLVNLKEYEKAEKAFALSAQYDRTNPEYIYQYASWLLLNGRKENGKKAMRLTLELDEAYIDQVITTMVLAGLNDMEMEEVIPNLPSSSLAFAKFLFDTGKRERATQKYIEILDIIEDQKNINKWDYFKIYGFFMKYNNIKDALEVMERAERVLPMDALIKVKVGDLYRKQGILYKAKEKYEHALLIDPKNQEALRWLKELNQ